MKSFLKLGFLAACLCLISMSVQAQKFGYLNSLQLLAEHPEVQKIDKDLTALEKKYKAEEERMLKAVEVKYADFLKKVQEKSISEQQMETEAKQIEKMRNDLYAYDKEKSDELLKKREQRLSPVLKKLDKVIQEVAVENGYQYIFDVSGGTFLFAKDSDNVLPLVKKKIGL